MQISTMLAELGVAIMRGGQNKFHFSLGLDTQSHEDFYHDSRFGMWWAGTCKKDHRRVDVSYIARQVKAAHDAM